MCRFVAMEAEAGTNWIWLAAMQSGTGSSAIPHAPFASAGSPSPPVTGTPFPNGSLVNQPNHKPMAQVVAFDQVGDAPVGCGGQSLTGAGDYLLEDTGALAWSPADFVRKTLMSPGVDAIVADAERKRAASDRQLPSEIAKIPANDNQDAERLRALLKLFAAWGCASRNGGDDHL